MQYIIATLDAFLGASEVHIMQLWKVEAVNNMQSKLYFDICRLQMQTISNK